MNKKIIVLIVVSILLTSCGGVTPVPTATPTLTATALPTKTPLPTNTSIPEPSATVTPSRVEMIFALPTLAPFRDTPTPIAIPSLGYSSMQLRNLSEDDILELIDEMNQYSYQNFPLLLGSRWTEGDFVVSQIPAALAIQEYLYRFPNSPNVDRLRWQLAFISSLSSGSLAGNQYGYEWIVAELQRRLNQGETTPDHLENILHQYPFTVGFFLNVQNLFGDGKTGWLYWIDPQVSEDYSLGHGGLIIAVREVETGKFKITILSKAPGSDSYIFEVDDHNKNGTPEIALYNGVHSGTHCQGRLMIYEWREGGFDELTNGNVTRNDCGNEFEYSELNGIPAIYYSGFNTPKKELYLWNGAQYEFSRYIGMTQLEIWRNSVIAGRLSHADEVELLKQVLASSTEYTDFLRYRLGIVYAFESRSGEAIAELQDLISSPVDETSNIFPTMAQKFLESYTDNASIYEACRQSRKVYEKTLAPYLQSNGFPNQKFDDNPVGFGLVDYYDFDSLVCNNADAFNSLVNSISPAVGNLPSELRKHGVDVSYSQAITVNLSAESMGWLVVFGGNKLFLVFSDGAHYQAKTLNAFQGWAKVDCSSIRVYVERFDSHQNPFVIIQCKQDFAIYEIDKSYNSKSVFDTLDVINYRVSDQTATPQFQVFYSEPKSVLDYPTHPWDGYRWNAEKMEFEDDLLEYNLFIAHDPKKSVEISEMLLLLLNHWKNFPHEPVWWSLPHEIPYTYYIIGLSYELSGEQQKAAQIYWQLWHDFPETHYALLARYKLEQR